MARFSLLFPGWVLIVCLALTGIGLFGSPQPADAASSAVKALTQSAPKDSAKVELPAKLTDASIDSFMAQLSDDQVRRLLIGQLKTQAQTETQALQPEEEPTVFLNAVGGVRDLITHVGLRIQEITSGEPIKVHSLPDFWKSLYDGTSFKSLSRVFAIVLGIFLIGLVAAAGLNAGMSRWRQWVAATKPADPWSVKLWRTVLNFFLDVAVVIGFVIVTLIVFFGFLDKGDLQRLIHCAFLVAFTLVAMVWVVSRSTLMPHLDNLRYLPLTGDLARFLHRWALLIVAVAAVGNFTGSMLIIKQIPEIQYLLVNQAITLTIVAMLIYMLTAKRHVIGRMLGQKTPEGSLRRRLALSWHWLGIAYVLVVWLVASVVTIISGVRIGMPGLASLFSVPLFFMLDWVVQRAFAALMGKVRPTQTADGATSEASPVAEASSDTKMDRFYTIMRGTLRFLVAVAVFVWLMGVWGLDLTLGRTIARGGLSIIVTVLIGYVIWELINTPIERRLKQELSGHDEDMEEGGAGGSRLGTLLVLLRKFLLSSLIIVMTLVALSAIGVNVGPLIAGAGIFGLAIGFGAQALVKDIISGIFFLIDDAFRVGDYIEAGSIKGMVEKISLRSMQIRHPRGMVHTVQFGDVSSITNFSRDYIVTKLTFRVTYDTDIEEVRKIVKKMYKQFLKDENLGPKLLGKLKSQGVRELDDSAMVMRVKFKTAPGEQFMLRREIFQRLQKAFKENGIKFAHRNVTVYMPDTESGAKDPNAVAEAGAAAALATEPPKGK